MFFFPFPVPKFKLNHHRMPKPGDCGRGRFLPDIRQQQEPAGGPGTKCLRNVDPSRPITLQLGNGPCTQAIDLPTDKLDKNKRYLVTFTIKGASDGPQDRRQRPPPTREDGHRPLAHTHAKSF